MFKGVLLFCDVTVLSRIARGGQPQPGTSDQEGSLLVAAPWDTWLTYFDRLFVIYAHLLQEMHAWLKASNFERLLAARASLSHEMRAWVKRL